MFFTHIKLLEELTMRGVRIGKKSIEIKCV